MILESLRKKHQLTGKAPGLIHTNQSYLFPNPGSVEVPLGLLADNAAGVYSTDTVYSNFDVDVLQTLPLTAPHQEVNKAVLEADVQGLRLALGCDSSV